MIKWKSGEVIADEYINSGMYVEINAERLPVMMPKIEGDTPMTAENLNKIVEGIAPDEYNSTATYDVNDYCIYNNVLYKCITAVTVAEAFDSSKWEQTTVSDEIKLLSRHKEKILLLQDTLTATSGDIITSIIDFTLYDKIVVQFADPGEGDSVVFEIDKNGVPINTVAHFYNFATNDYHCHGFVFIQDSKVKVHLQSLAGWGDNTVKIYGITK